ncbi:hypothetical protein GCM10007350_08700 [Jeongeupia chitinilytica]|uniref:Toxin CptA n=1 Tax=Jeongeupia chitinilytica TaxID=1041641 RepID=A0ABQ3GWK6_9NEIS|nr:hypothetical protein GCM10007350_08700 [Jeongeupia chitinilytica]
MPLQLRPSRQARLVHAAAFVAAAAAALASSWAVVGLLWLAAGWVLTRRRVQPAAIAACDDGTLVLHWQDGRISPATLGPASRVGIWLVSLQFIGGRGRIALVLWPDSADIEALRQWRVWLRWERPAILRRLQQAADPR